MTLGSILSNFNFYTELNLEILIIASAVDKVSLAVFRASILDNIRPNFDQCQLVNT